jgi:hypothetical protein
LLLKVDNGRQVIRDREMDSESPAWWREDHSFLLGQKGTKLQMFVDGLDCCLRSKVEDKDELDVAGRGIETESSANIRGLLEC